ncbi:MAG: hypothetical protein Q9176_003058 [Flavoplaca citrina]
MASGYRMALVATGLTKPRSIAFDTAGNLVVVESGSGISNLALQDDGDTCVSVRERTVVVQNSELNHGLSLSQDGRTLYASDPDAVHAWSYNPEQSTVSGDSRTLISNMDNDGHTTRTLLLSEKTNGTLIVSRGSNSNVDLEAARVESGHCQLKAFEINNVDDAYDFTEDGLLLGWGLRNSVGVAEHPDTGGIYSVENSVDEIMREGEDVHQDNPGEEMNFHGYLNGTEYGPQGSNYGYPYCFASWAPEDLPQNENLKIGNQFAMGDQNNTVNDAFCADQSPPRLTFQAHMAPLDIKFNNSGTEAWVTFHGSWDRTSPVGYKLSVIPFANGEPVAAPDNKTAASDVFVNVDNSKCPRGCFRPVGIAFDRQGRLFMSSDSTGEIYVLVRDQASQGSTGSTSGDAATTPPSAAPDIGHSKDLNKSNRYIKFSDNSRHCLFQFCPLAHYHQLVPRSALNSVELYKKRSLLSRTPPLLSADPASLQDLNLSPRLKPPPRSLSALTTTRRREPRLAYSMPSGPIDPGLGRKRAHLSKSSKCRKAL